MPDITVRLGSATRTVSLPGYAVFVADVLPADSAQRVPKPARALFENSLIPVVVLGAARRRDCAAHRPLVVVAQAAARSAGRRSCRPVRSRASATSSASTALGLVEAGERSRYVALVVDVLREYIADRFTERAARPHEHRAARRATQQTPTLPHDRLMRILNEADLVKFAKRPVSVDRARDMGQEARALVEHEHQASQPAPVAARSRPHDRPRLRAVRLRVGARPAARAAGVVDLETPPAAAGDCLLATAVVGRGPARRAASTTLTLFLPPQPAARGRRRRARAPAQRRARRERHVAGHQHRHRHRSVELDARAGLPAAEPARGRQGDGQAIHRRPNRDRIGIVAFAAEALTQVPLTTDYPVVAAAVDNLAAGQLEDGTAIGTAIATAANRLRDAPGNSRVMIVLTDGENNRGAIDPRTAAKAAAAFNIRIYTIGVGTEGMAPVPVGQGVFGLRYENRPVRIDEPLLTDIATTTGGRYFRARDAAALQRIYEQINQLEREPGADQDLRPIHGALSLAVDAGDSRARRGAPARRLAGTASMNVSVDHLWLLPLAIILPIAAVLLLQRSYRARQQAARAPRHDVRRQPARPAVGASRATVAHRAPRARRTSHRRRGRRPALGHRARGHPVEGHRHGPRARCVAVDARAG